MRRLRCYAAALAGGALLGVTFTLAEVTTGYLAGGRFPPRFWLFLAVYAVPVLAVGGVVAQAVRAACGNAASPWHPGLLLTVLFFVYVSAILNHQLLSAYPFLSAIRFVSLLAATAATGVVFRTLAPAGTSPAVSARNVLVGYGGLPCLLTLSGWLAVTTLGPLGRGLAAILFLPAVTAGFLAGSHLLARILPPQASLRRVAAGGIVASLAATAILAGALLDPREAARFSRSGRQPEPSGRGPNVVLIVLDTLRAANMSTYGYSRRTTPHLDAFTHKAVAYERHLAPSSWSLPGHASLFTGLLPSRHGADGPTLDDPRPVQGGYPLAPELDTLAEILSRHGYATAGIVSNFGIVGRAFGLDQGFRHYDASPSADFLRLPFPPLLSRVQGRLEGFLPLKQTDWFLTACRPAEEITDLALRWLAARRRGQPFLLFLNYMDAHDYTPRGRFRDLWPGRSAKGQSIFRGLGGVVTGARDITPEEADHVRSLYDGSISYLDEHLGRLLDALERDPEFDDTWIVITSDHGESLGEHRTLQHQCSLYQEILWTPLIVRYPARTVARLGDDVRPGAAAERPVQAMDVLPTILEGSSLPVPEGLDGRPIHEGRGQAVAEYFVNQELAREAPQIGRREMRALIEGDWKLIETTSGNPQLYDLRRDPGERTDLAAATPEVVTRLRASLARERSALDATNRRRQGFRLTPEQRDALRAVGYLR